MLDTESIIWIFLILCRLDVDPSLGALHTFGVWVLNNGGSAGLGLDVGGVGGGVLVHGERAVILLLQEK